MKTLLLCLWLAVAGHAAQLQSLTVQTIPSFIYSWGWHLVNFQLVDVEPGQYVLEESADLKQWRVCADFQVLYSPLNVTMIQEDLGGQCRFYRIAKLEERAGK